MSVLPGKPRGWVWFYLKWKDQLSGPLALFPGRAGWAGNACSFSECPDFHGSCLTTRLLVTKQIRPVGTQTVALAMSPSMSYGSSLQLFFTTHIYWTPVMAYKRCGLHTGTRHGPALKRLQPVKKISELGGQRRRYLSLHLCVQSLMLYKSLCPPLEYRVKERFRDLWLLEEAPSACVHPVLFLQCHQSRGDPQRGDPSVGRSGTIHLQVSPQHLPACQPENAAAPPVAWAPVSSQWSPQRAAREAQVLTTSVCSSAGGGHTAVNERLCGWASPSLLCLEMQLLLPELENVVTKPWIAACSPYPFKVAPDFLWLPWWLSG